VKRRFLAALGFAMPLIWFCPADATAQSSNLWLTAGTGFTALRGDCQTCEEEFPYRRAASVLANGGRRVHSQTDVGAEVFWMRAESAAGEVRTTHIDAVAQFRPWASKGFFVKGGAGMAFVRNWVDAIGPVPINQKALSVVIGTGWAFRTRERFGLQVFGAQHVAALGDLQTSGETVENVVGNFWSLGAAIVIR
jgi:hypothetical protein